MASAKGGSWVFDPKTGNLIPKSEYLRDKFASVRHARSELSCPTVINDGLDYLFSHVDGRRYTSKRAYEKSVRAAGCHIVGNEDISKHVSPSYDEAKHEADITADVCRAVAELKVTS
jgi:hypothetical protein